MEPEVRDCKKANLSVMANEDANLSREYPLKSRWSSSNII